MSGTVTRDGDKLVVRVHGKLDAVSSPALEEELQPQLDGVTDLTIDVQDVDFVSSMGLRLLLSLQKRMFKQGGMHVIHVSDDIMQLFDDTGFSQIIDTRR